MINFPKFMRGKSKKSLIAGSFLAILVVLVTGGGVYAALGGNILQSSSNDVNLQKGLVGYWKLDGNAKDSTVFHNNGTVTGATLTTDRKTKAASAYNFNGSSKISIPSFNCANTITVSAWVYPTSTNTDSKVVGKHSTGQDVQGTLGVRDNKPSFEITAGGNYQLITAPSAIPMNTWSHIDGVYDGSSIIIYVNGVNVGSIPISGSLATNSWNWSIGSIHGGSTVGGFSGSIDDVRIYGRAINAAEAKALNENYAPQVNAASGEKGLVGWWKLDGNAKDSTVNHQNGTVTGATLTTDRKGRANSAYSFNGTTNFINIPTSSTSNAVPFSMEAWFKLSTTGGSYTILGSTSDSGPQLRVSPSNKIQLLKQAVSDPCGPSSSTVSAGVWYHVALTLDVGGSCSMYVNGALDHTQIGPAPSFTFSNYKIGSMRGTNEFFSGSLDDVRVYNRIVSASEISAHYNSYDSQINLNSTPTSSTTTGNINQGLVGYWPFSGNAKDSTVFHNNGTITGATLASDRWGRANSAYTVGNSSAYINVGSPSTYASLTSTGFTYSIWLMRTGASAYQWPHIMGAFDSHTYYGIRSQNFGDSITFEWGNSPYDGSAFNNSSAGSLPVNEWHHFAYTYDGSLIRCYEDGVALPASGPRTLNPTFGGLSFSTSVQGWSGSIDDARIYNRPLSATEIQSLYNSQN